MAKINRVLILFLVIMSAIIFGTWEYIQTERFAGLISYHVTTRVGKYIGVELKFKRLEFQFFPPATVFKDVELKSINEKFVDGVDLYIKASDLGVYFNVLDVFDSSLKIQKIKIKDGRVDLATDKIILSDKFFRDLIFKKDSKDEELELPNLFSLFADYRKLLTKNKNVVISSLGLESVNLNFNQSKVWFEKLQADLGNEKLGIEFNIHDIFLYSPQKGELDFNIDLLQINSDFKNGQINLKKFIAKKDLNTIELSGLLNQKNNEQYIEANAHYIGPVETIIDQYKLPKEFEKISGLVNVGLKIFGNVKNPNFKSHLKLAKVKTLWIDLEEADLEIDKKENDLYIKNVSVKDETGQAKSFEEYKIFNLKNREFYNQPIALKVDNVSAKTAFHYVPALSPLDAFFSGVVNFSWNKDGLIFSPQQGFIAKKIKVQFPKSEKALIDSDLLEFVDGNFIVKWDGLVKLDAKIKFINSALDVDGEVSNVGVDVKIKAGSFDFEKFGPISGIKFNGQGKIELHAHGPFENVAFDFDADMKDISVIGLNLGRLTGKFNFDLPNSKLTFFPLKGQFNSSLYDAEGIMFFDDHPSMDLKFSFKKTNWEDSKVMYKLVTDKMNFLPADLQFDYSTSYRVTGGFSIEDVNISGKISGHDYIAYGEEIDLFSMDFDFTNKVFSFDNIVATKNIAKIYSNFLFDFNKDYMEYSARIERSRLKDFNFYRSLNLGMDADVFADFRGSGMLGNMMSKGKILTKNASIGAKQVGASEFNYEYNNSLAHLEVNLIDGMATGDADIYTGTSSNKLSHINFDMQTFDMPMLLGLLSEHNLNDKILDGHLDIASESSFTLDKLDGIDIFFKINDFSINRDRSSFNAHKNSYIHIVNGKIEHWKMLFSGPFVHWSSEAEGHLFNSGVFKNSFNVDASLLEILSDKFQSAQGQVFGNFEGQSQQGQFTSKLVLNGSKVYMKFLNIPGTFADLVFNFTAANRNGYLNKMEGIYCNGKVTAEGPIWLKLPFPKIGLNLTMDNSNIPFFKKSNVVVNGKVNVAGNSIPYLATGGISFMHTNFFDEFSEFSKGKKQEKVSSKYLPSSSKTEIVSYLKYNVDLSIPRPMNVKNNIADMKVNGSLKIFGEDNRPLPDGDFWLVPGVSKLNFKGNEFTMDDGKVSFLDSEKKIEPLMKFSGVTRVNEYNIRLDFNGRPSNFTLNFTSDPMLPQEDIVSLLTLGLTLDKSKGLDATDLQSVTSIGLGGVLLDQFGINQGLNSSLGLKLSVLPEFQRSQVSPIQKASNSSSDLGTSRLKSATKIRVQKKINKKTDISVSSTVGGDIVQKREMNVDYNIDRNFSLKGVYEIRSSTGTETKENSDSMGMDFIFRRTFK